MSRFKRIRTYLHEMYPIWVHLPYTLLAFLNLSWLMMAFSGIRPLEFTPVMIAGAITTMLYPLMLRIFDEFKDAEADLTLFPDRPLPSGRVTRKDLNVLLAFVMATMVGVNIPLGKAFWAFLAAFVYALLMFKYFFMPELHRRSLLFTLLTHQPSTLMIQLYIMALFVWQFHHFSPLYFAMIWMGWGVVLAWEMARKVKAPEQENSYVTYSRLFGPRLAAVFPGLALASSGAIALYFAMRLGFQPWAILALGLVVVGVVVGFLRFIVAPTSRNNHLKAIVEGMGIALHLIVFLALISGYGVIAVAH